MDDGGRAVGSDLQPCQGVCDDVVEKCSDFLLSVDMGSQIPNCSATDPTTGEPLYPTSSCNNASAGICTPFSSRHLMVVVCVVLI
jgi:hypothetical protein